MKNEQCRAGAWGAVLTAVAAAGVLAGCGIAPKPITREPAPQRTLPLPQNWSPAQSQWFHHASQGTATLPVDYEWFLALEQPGLTAGERPLFSDPGYLRSWGFIDSRGGPDGLPVGFARTENFVDPMEAGPPRRRNAIGFTCAACHTGQFTYRGTRVVVDGGPSQADVTGMATAMGLALLETAQGALTFDRFARRLLKERDSIESRQALMQQLKAAEKKVVHLALLTKATEKGSVPEGYGRLDALNRIGNQVFSLDARRDANFAPTNAPVSYPAIWNTSWFNWVQYDGSIMQPMVRNAGEALGVAAGVTFGTGPQAYKSSVNIANLHEIETAIAGKTPPLPAKAFSGLASPRWPVELLGTPAPERVARGRALYDQLCAGCHLPPVGTDAFWNAKHWAPLPGSQHSYLKLPIIPVEEIGTDPAQAAVLATRKVDTTGMGVNARVWTPSGPGGCTAQAQPVTDGPAVPFPLALGAVVQQVIDVAYQEQQIPPARWPELNGDRPNCLQAGGGYRARPLNGMWATAPYLHNGSVLTLYELLSPVAERRPVIHLGNLEFDSERVGLLDGDKLDHATRIDTSKPGNSNAGHEFTGDGKKGKGIIGRLLTPAERTDLVEFLKTL